MKHLREIEEFDEKDFSEEDLDDFSSMGFGKAMGYVISRQHIINSSDESTDPRGRRTFRSHYFIVVANTLEEAFKIFVRNGTAGSKYYEWSDKKIGIKTFEDFAYKWVTAYSMKKDVLEMDYVIDCHFFEGLIPRSGEQRFIKIDGQNPYFVSSYMNELFSNAEEVFNKVLHGNQIVEKKIGNETLK